MQNALIAQWLMHRALTKINSVTVDTETDPGLGCATSARLPNMWPVAGNPLVRAPQGNYGNREHHLFLRCLGYLCTVQQRLNHLTGLWRRQLDFL